MFIFAPSTRRTAKSCLSGTTGSLRANVNWRAFSSLVRTADDPPLAIDIDPDYAAVLNELETVVVTVEFGPQIIGAAHEGEHSTFKLRKRHRPALANALESTVGVPARLLKCPPGFTARWFAQRRSTRQPGGKYRGKKGSEHRHLRDSLGRLVSAGIE